MDKLKITFEKLVLCAILALFCLNAGTLITIHSINHKINKEHYNNSNIEYIKDKYVERLESEFCASRDNLADELDKYLNEVAPNTLVNALTLIDLTTEYNVDLLFVLSQGQIESHFATKGTATKTNSIFNVGAYDGHSAEEQKKNGFGFSHPDFSIEPYLKLLVNDYLVNGKTEMDLMTNYVNKHDKRYASYKGYESSLLTLYTKLNDNTSLSIAYQTYKMYKTKLGK